MAKARKKKKTTRIRTRPSPPSETRVVVTNEKGEVIGHVDRGGCSNEACLAAIAEGRLYHAIPAAFGVTLSTYHYADEASAVRAIERRMSTASVLGDVRYELDRIASAMELKHDVGHEKKARVFCDVDDCEEIATHHQCDEHMPLLEEVWVVREVGVPSSVRAFATSEVAKAYMQQKVSNVADTGNWTDVDAWTPASKPNGSRPGSWIVGPFTVDELTVEISEGE